MYQVSLQFLKLMPGQRHLMRLARWLNTWKSVFLLTPWTSTQSSKADLMAREDFAEILLSTSKILRDQYKGNQPLVQEILGPNPPCLVPVQTAICILRKQGDQFKKFSPPENTTRIGWLVGSPGNK